MLTLVSGCGSSSESTPADARSEIEATVRKGLTEKDPSWCKTSATLRLLEQLAGDSHGNPLQVCRVNAVLPGDTEAHRVEFRSVRVDANRAEVTVFLIGGDGDGSTLRSQLVHRRERWRIDYIADIQIDRERFDAATRRSFLNLGVGSKEADCAVDRLRRFYDTDELERAFVAGETDGYDAAEAICLSRASLTRFLDLALRKSAPKDIDSVIVECISRRITHSLSTDQLRAFFGAADELRGYLDRLAGAAAIQCAKDAQTGLLPEPSPS